MRAHAHDLRSEIANDWGSLVNAERNPLPDAAGLDAFVRAAAADWRACPWRDDVSALLAFAAKMTGTPAAMTRADVDGLRAAGWSDAAIHDATQVVAYFNYINRVADALGVDPEPGIPAWEELEA